jgi:hypothetical protein
VRYIEHLLDRLVKRLDHGDPGEHHDVGWCRMLVGAG